jgi:hypothetical protein
MALDLFSFIENLFNKKTYIDSTNPFKESYMTIKFLSLYPGTFTLATQANRLSMKMPYWATNAFLFHSIKKQRAVKISYPKGAETKEKKWPPEAIEKISRQCCCSVEYSIQMLRILESQNPLILESLGIGPESEKKRRGKNR